MKKFIAKIVLLGDASVGKTSIKRRFMEGRFDPTQQTTIGADFSRVVLDVASDIQLIMQVWDIAGQARFVDVTDSYFRGAKGAMLVYDVTREATFQSIPHWINKLVSITGEKVPVILIGNKIDLVDQIVVDQERAEEYAEILSDWIGYPVVSMWTSALAGINVEDAFYTLAHNIVSLVLHE